jgi:glutamate dehydrogenase (NAD(P)+)
MSSHTRELQRITRRFTHALGSNIGPDYDIPAPDVGTNAQVMVWMMDTYMNTVGHVAKNAQQRVVTGKSAHDCGGSRGPREGHGPGQSFTASWSGRATTASNLEGKTAIIQGFGNVGSHTALLLAKPRGVHGGGGGPLGLPRQPEGFNVHKLADHVRATGSIEGYEGGRPITPRGVLRHPGRPVRAGAL